MALSSESPGSRPVFLSYASQDAEAAKRIADALRAAGVEVWFDKSELRGGDAWDAKIRRQIKDCALFVPVISANTQARPEGYFRLEWKLAVDRSHLMADDQPFLLPVVIDDIPDAVARVPERFREVQWTRLRLDETPAEFGQRVHALLAGGDSLVAETGALEEPRAEVRARTRNAHRGPPTTLETILRYWWLPFPLFGVAMAVRGAWSRPDKERAQAVQVAAASSASQELVARARAIFDRGDLTRENLATSEQLCDQAIAADPNSAEAWAARAQVHAWFYFYAYDVSAARKAKASADIARAVDLAPNSPEVKFAQAAVLTKVVALPGACQEAEKILRELMSTRPDDARLADLLGLLLRATDRKEEAAAYFEKANNPAGAAWTYFQGGEFERAMRAIDAALQQSKSVSSLVLKAILEQWWREDLDAAQAAIDQLPASTWLSESYAMTPITLALYRGDDERALAIIRALPNEYFSALGFRGPKAALLAVAHEVGGRQEAAKAEWRAALKIVEQRLAAEPNNSGLLGWKAMASAALGDKETAKSALRLGLELSGSPPDTMSTDTAVVWLRVGESERVLDWIARQLTTKPKGWERWHSAARYDPHFAPLREDVRLQRLLREHLPNGAKPFPAE